MVFGYSKLQTLELACCSRRPAASSAICQGMIRLLSSCRQELTAFTCAQAAASTTALDEDAADANEDERKSLTELQAASERSARAPEAAETPRNSTPRGTTQGGRGLDAESQDHPGECRHGAQYPVSNGYSTPGSTTSAGSWRRRGTIQLPQGGVGQSL